MRTPLSYGQEALWFLCLQHPGIVAYNMCVAFAIEGEFDAARFEDALGRVVERHCILGSTIEVDDGVPFFRSDAAHKVRVQMQDGEPPSSQEDAERLIAGFASAPFDLSSEPPLRVLVVRASESCHYAAVGLHHIAGDARSLDLIASDLSAFYTGDVLPKAVQYGDFVECDALVASSPKHAEARDYWKQQLSGVRTSFELPVQSQRPPVRAFRGGVFESEIPAETQRALSELCGAMHRTAPSVLFAIYCSLLHRYTCCDDFIVGLPLSGRDEPRFEQTVGLFANVAPIRVSLDRETQFDALVESLWLATLEALDHGLPFPIIVRDLDPTRDSSREPLVQNMFNYVKVAPCALRIAGANVRRLDIIGASAKYDFSLEFIDDGRTIKTLIVYDADLFDSVFVECFHAHFIEAIGSVCQDSTQLVRDLSFLPAAEKNRLLSVSKGPALASPADRTLSSYFAEAVDRSGDKIAIISDEGEQSYLDLDSSSTAIANLLNAYGVGPESVVAICMDRSARFLTAALGAIKVGAAYLPIDPEYPAERQMYMLSDSGAALLLTRGTWLDQFASVSVPVIDLDASIDAPRSDPACTGVRSAVAGNIAYVIYTSGSTGRPKGVLVEQRNLVNLVEDWRSRMAVDQERFSFWTSTGFDVSVWESLLPLLCGATVCIPRESIRADAREFIEWMNANQVTTAYLPPHIARQLPEVVALGMPLPRNILVGVEPLDEGLLHHVTVLSRSKLFNAYGPTEATIYVTVNDDEPTDRTRPFPIGYAIANTTVSVLDPSFNPVPDGVEGEICIAGAGVSRGYLNRPALTAEAFVPDPHGPPGTRMYRTGDLACRTADGNLKFLGRKDHQIKLRGYRVELGEIENALIGTGLVREAVVLAEGDESVGKHLVAHIVPAGTGCGARQLAALLKGVLPGYMVPAKWSFVSDMPRNAHGKINRSLLRAAAPKNEGVDSEQRSVGSDTEHQLVDIWRQLLRNDSVTSSDNFFRLGGHSLLAARMVHRLHQRMGVTVSIAEILGAPSLSELARIVARKRRGTEERIPATPPGTASSPVSFAQERMLILDQLEHQAGLYNVSLSWIVDGPLDRDALARSFSELAARHESLRTVFAMVDSEYRQRSLDRGEVCIVETDLRGGAATVEIPSDLLIAEVGRKFDLETDLPLRVSLFRTGEEQVVLLVVLHHIVFDGWSIHILTKELGALYAANVAGKTLRLPELPIRYTDYARWQRECMRDETMENHLAFWKGYLDGATARLALPFDRVPPAVPTRAGDLLRFEFEDGLGSRLRDYSQRHQASVFAIMAAALVALYYRYSGQEDICIGYPAANRDHVETEGLVGLLVNTLVLRARVSSGTTFDELVAQLKASLIDGYRFQDLPFERLVDEIRPQRDLSTTPVFQAMLTIDEDLPGSDLELQGATATVLDLPRKTAKFDVVFGIKRNEGRVAGFIEYSTELFDAVTIERMADHFRRLLDSALTDGNRWLCELDILGAQGPASLLAGESTVTPDRLTPACIHARFESWAERTPNAVALKADGRTLSYSQLNERANRLAHRLLDAGVGAEDIVVLFVERSFEALIAMLAVLKAGAAYLPIDPKYPLSRRALLLEQSGARVVLATERLVHDLPHTGATVIGLDPTDGALRDYPATNPWMSVSPGHLAYVMYTSGSTGTPKGVCVQHANVVSLVCDNAYVSIGQHDVFLQSSLLSFDASTFEIWGALLNGARLVVPSPMRLSVGDLENHVRDDGVTILWLTAALFDLHASSRPEALRGVRQLLAGGDVLPPKAVRNLLPMSPGCALINGYGPTETTTFATTYRFGPELCSASAPIGRPIARGRVYVLDRRLRPVPPGIVGELYVAGGGVSRGYKDDPRLTAERFLPDPYGPPGARMYATGDSVRMTGGGDIQFVGRFDHQVKIRGFRVELAEVEGALNSCAGVKSAVVVAHSSEGGDKSLMAYVVPESEPLNGDDLKRILLSRLPDYMVPSQWIFLQALPINANGKVDRKALPASRPARDDSATAFVEPANDTQRRIADVWKQVLRLERVGAHDNFFSIGGHSLHAAKVLMQFTARYGWELTLRDLFTHVTVESLAIRIDTRSDDSARARPVLKRMPRTQN